MIAPTQDIGAINPEHAAAASLSRKLPWNKIDAIPEEIQDPILWWAEHGPRSTPPPPGPNASPYERSRAATAWSMIAKHENVSAWLAATPDPNDPRG